MYALNGMYSGRLWRYVKAAPLVFVVITFSNELMTSQPQCRLAGS
jgi:hypothetical protein